MSLYNQQGMPGRGLQNSFYANITAPTTYSFSSQIFSNAQATSNLGPTQSQLNTVYPSLAPTYLTSNVGIQTWTVPVTGVYSLVAAGASGGTASSVPSGGGAAGRGVIVGCQAIFQKNQILSLIVGQQGVSAALQNTSNCAGGGGGGSFIVDYSTGYLYIAAGGGGGASCPVSGQTASSSGFDATYDTYGINGVTGGSPYLPGAVSPGGVNGQGGKAFPSGGTSGHTGGGGGGFYTNGGVFGSGQQEYGQGGFAVLSGSQGGASANTLYGTYTTNNSFGGFGGGGGSGGSSTYTNGGLGAGGGGGGGYSGGGSGGCNSGGGGGGGSYVALGQTLQQLGFCTSNGYVSVSYLYPVSTQMTGTPLFSQLSASATSSAVGAFSLRAVNGTSVKAVQVRNGTTSATQDFWADRLGNLLTAPVTGLPLSAWLGGATGYVTTWYNQIQIGQDISQGTAANQPILSSDGRSITFNGSTQSFSNTSTSGGLLAECAGTKTKYTYVASWNPTTTSGNHSIMEHNASTSTNNNRSCLFQIAAYGFNGQQNDLNSLVSGVTSGTQYSSVMRVDNTDAGYAANGNKNIRIRSNGTNFSGATGNYAILFLNNYWFTVGRKASTNTEYFTGSIKNVMVFKDAISDADTSVLDAWQQAL